MYKKLHLYRGDTHLHLVLESSTNLLVHECLRLLQVPVDGRLHLGGVAAVAAVVLDLGHQLPEEAAGAAARAQGHLGQVQAFWKSGQKTLTWLDRIYLIGKFSDSVSVEGGNVQVFWNGIKVACRTAYTHLNLNVIPSSLSSRSPHLVFHTEVS